MPLSYARAVKDHASGRELCSRVFHTGFVSRSCCNYHPLKHEKLRYIMQYLTHKLNDQPSYQGLFKRQ